MIHSLSCIAAQRQIEKKHKEWVRKWPNYCRSCGGFGVNSWYENASPWGSGENWPMQVTDVCPSCLEQGKCPRCGREAWTEEEVENESLTCMYCGWDDEHPDAVPPETMEWDCECVLAAYNPSHLTWY